MYRSDKPGSPNSSFSSDSDNFFYSFSLPRCPFPTPSGHFPTSPCSLLPFLPIDRHTDLVHKKFPLSNLPFISARITTCTKRHICLLPSRKYTLIYRLSKRASFFRVSAPYQCPVQFYPTHPLYLFPTLSSSYFPPLFFLHRRFLASLLLLPFFFSFFRFHSVYHYVCHFLLPAPSPLSCHASSSTRPLHIDFPPQTEEGRDGRRRLPVSRVKADVT